MHKLIYITYYRSIAGLMYLLSYLDEVPLQTLLLWNDTVGSILLKNQYVLISVKCSFEFIMMGEFSTWFVYWPADVYNSLYLSLQSSIIFLKWAYFNCVQYKEEINQLSFYCFISVHVILLVTKHRDINDILFYNIYKSKYFKYI